MMVEKRGGKTKDTRMVKFSFSICSRDIGNDNCEALAKMFFLQGTSSKPGLLQKSAGMTPLILEGMGMGSELNN
jgi:hypothetical protein